MPPTETGKPSDRIVTPFTRDQQGWLVAALVAFIGVVFIGPAITSAKESSRRMKTRAGQRLAQTGRKIRRLGGGGPIKQVFRSGR